MSILLKSRIILSLACHKYLFSSPVYCPRRNLFVTMLCLSPPFSLCLSTVQPAPQSFPFCAVFWKHYHSINKFCRMLFSFVWVAYTKIWWLSWVMPVLYIFCRSLIDDSRGQCYRTNTAVIYCHFRLNYHRNIYNIEFTLEWWEITAVWQKITAVFWP